MVNFEQSMCGGGWKLYWNLKFKQRLDECLVNFERSRCGDYWKLNLKQLSYEWCQQRARSR